MVLCSDCKIATVASNFILRLAQTGVTFGTAMVKAGLLLNRARQTTRDRYEPRDDNFVFQKEKKISTRTHASTNQQLQQKKKRKKKEKKSMKPPRAQLLGDNFTVLETPEICGHRW